MHPSYIWAAYFSYFFGYPIHTQSIIIFETKAQLIPDFRRGKYHHKTERVVNRDKGVCSWKIDTGSGKEAKFSPG